MTILTNSIVFLQEKEKKISRNKINKNLNFLTNTIFLLQEKEKIILKIKNIFLIIIFPDIKFSKIHLF